MHKHMLKMITFCQNMLNGNIVLKLSSNFIQIKWQMFISKPYSAVDPLCNVFVQKIKLVKVIVCISSFQNIDLFIRNFKSVSSILTVNRKRFRHRQNCTHTLEPIMINYNILAWNRANYITS